MKRSLNSDDIQAVRSQLTRANSKFATLYLGDSTERQPVHTVYGGAHLFSSNLAKKMSEGALKALKTYAPTSSELAGAVLGDKKWNEAFWQKVYGRVVEKLQKEAVEDFRIDFEDGYGIRPDAEENSHAESTALEVAKGMVENSLPPFIGIRIKPFNEENVARSVQTLDLFVSTLLERTEGKLPSGFVITLPKVTLAEQSAALAEFLTRIEKKNHLHQGALKFEVMVETPQSIIDSSGNLPLRGFVEAGKGRCIGAHFGTYDYTAGCNITASQQTMINPVCDFAKHVMQVALAGTPVFLSDGATNIMPVGPHSERDGQVLSSAQKAENEAVVHRAWRISYQHIQHSLQTGFYQGWDLHPAQLPVRYAAVYSFFLESLDASTQRLKAFMDKAAKATLLGDVFDDAATGQGLLNFFLRAMSCGAIQESEVEATGLSMDDIRTRSFAKVLQRRSRSRSS